MMGPALGKNVCFDLIWRKEPSALQLDGIPYQLTNLLLVGTSLPVCSL